MCDISNLAKLHANCTLRESGRGHSLKLYQERSRINIRKESFPLRITKVCNQLSENVISAPSVNTFKNRLDRHWRGEDVLYNYRAPIPGEHREEDRTRRMYEDLTIED